MWPFSRKRDLPGINREADGRISFTFTDEEEAEVHKSFASMKGPEEGQGEWYIHPEAHKALTAWALIGYSQTQVWRAERDGVGRLDRRACIERALAAAGKAYALHPLPIYMFDMGCLLEMLGETPSARDAYERFLKAQRNFHATELDNIILKNRDVATAVQEARKSLGV
jgi:hypothetical protein